MIQALYITQAALSVVILELLSVTLEGLDVYYGPLNNGLYWLVFLLLFQPQLLVTVCIDIPMTIQNDPISVKIHLTGQLCYNIFICVIRLGVFNTNSMLSKYYWV